MVRFRRGPGRANGGPAGPRASGAAWGSPQTAGRGGRASDLRNIPHGPQRGICKLSPGRRRDRRPSAAQPPRTPRSRPSPETHPVVWTRTSPAGAAGCGEPRHPVAWLRAERLWGRGRHSPHSPLGQVPCRPTGPALSPPGAGLREASRSPRGPSPLEPRSRAFPKGEAAASGVWAGPCRAGFTGTQQQVPDTPSASVRRPLWVGHRASRWGRPPPRSGLPNGEHSHRLPFCLL